MCTEQKKTVFSWCCICCGHLNTSPIGAKHVSLFFKSFNRLDLKVLFAHLQCNPIYHIAVSFTSDTSSPTVLIINFHQPQLYPAAVNCLQAPSPDPPQTENERTGGIYQRTRGIEKVCGGWCDYSNLSGQSI